MQAGPVPMPWTLMKSITPYICSDGWFKGTICGLKVEFAAGESHQTVLCGSDDSHGHAYVPRSLGPAKKFVFSHTRFNSFFVNTSPDGAVITKIGWTVAED